MTGDEMNETKFEFYFTNEAMVHVNCKSGRFYNGTILEINKVKKYIILKDRVVGELPIMFEEIISIDPFKEVGE